MREREGGKGRREREVEGVGRRSEREGGQEGEEE